MAEEGKMTYSEKLKSPKWQKKRLEIMQRDDWTCQICGDTETTLHVHHYLYSGNPWEINNKYLKTLCENCHDYEHEYIGEMTEALNSHIKELTSDCVAILSTILYIISDEKSVNKILNHLRVYVIKLKKNSFKECENDIKVIKLYEDK